MKNLQPKTIEEHCEYLYDVVKLKLHWMHGYLNAHPEESFSSVIRNRVDIYRKTDANREALNPVHLYFEESPWLDMEKAASECFIRFKDDAAAFEQNAFEIFKPSILTRLERDFRDLTGTEGYQCGSLRYENATFLSETTGKRTIGFHVANAIQPHSIFEDPHYLKMCFEMLLWSAENLYGAEEIATGTWLNQVPAWLRFFPEEWKQNMSVPDKDVQWHYGFWGQFISAKGTFNAKNGKYLRETGEFPYYPRASHCSIKAMREHLARM